MARLWHHSKYPHLIPVQRVIFSKLFDVSTRLIGLWDETTRFPFLKTQGLGWVAALEAAWPEIRQEAQRVLAQKELIPNIEALSPEQESLSKGEGWKTFCLYLFGVRVEANCCVTPRTVQILKDIPGLRSAVFSILGAGKTLPPHRGLYRGLLRYQLALKIPSPASLCGIRVGNEIREWEEGKSLLFDDTFEHEVWNRSTEDRMVLYLDIVRPLPLFLGWLNRLVIWSLSHSDFMEAIHSKLNAHNAAHPFASGS
jgi:ornithine lipid ester-linked acyl 2-hydroxylase